MKNFNNIIQESILLEKDQAIVPRNMSMVSGSSLCKTFTEKETRRIISTMKRHSSDADYKLADFIEDVEDADVKYSDTIVISLNNVLFSLYSSYGVLRTGAGGNTLSDAKKVRSITSNNIIDFWKRDPQVIKR